MEISINADGEVKDQVISQVHVFVVVVHGIALTIAVLLVVQFRLYLHQNKHITVKQKEPQYTVYLVFGAADALILTTMDIWFHHQLLVRATQYNQDLAAVIVLVVEVAAAVVDAEHLMDTDVIQEQAEHLLI